MDIKRLHEVHKLYPNTPRGFGKTTYCFDALLRVSQTGVYKKLMYVTDKVSTSRLHFINFLRFLEEIGEDYKVLNESTVILNNNYITFSQIIEHDPNDFEAIIEDYETN